MLKTYYDEFLDKDVEVDYEESQYTLVYQGNFFYGDCDGVNFHDYDSWEEVVEIYDRFIEYDYDKDVMIRDNYYGVTLQHGEWY